MDTRLHHLLCQILLKPVFHNDPPEIVVSFDSTIIYAGHLSTDLELTIDQQLPPGKYQLDVEFKNKNNTDTTASNDKAVIIQQVSFNKIHSKKFAWAGVYQPVYPEPWATEQRLNNIELKPQLTAHTYLGWNGKWTLTFSMPIFTWIHQTENLGWIYS